MEFNATIIHEFGHALKLSHPWIYDDHQKYNHIFHGARGGVEEDTYYSVMGECSFIPFNEYYIPTNYGSQIPTKFDKINLISKWEYHSQCS